MTAEPLKRLKVRGETKLMGLYIKNAFTVNIKLISEMDNHHQNVKYKKQLMSKNIIFNSHCVKAKIVVIF